MMMATKQGKHWRAVIGALAVAGFAFGLSLRLEGAAHVPGGVGSKVELQKTTVNTDVQRDTRIEQSQRSVTSGEPVVYGNLADLMSGNIPTLPTVVVDYRDDEGTRMREAGLLDGPLPLVKGEGGVAGGACSFDVDCDDGNRCTVDNCNFPPGGPAGSGTCIHTSVPDGQDTSLPDTTCPDHFGSACGGCNDGLFCNGVESCQSGVCVAGTPPCGGGQVCSETFNLCQDLACSSAADCSNAGVVGATFAAEAAKKCNGVETCVSGVCVAGENPCGPGALCSEKQCSLGPSVDFCLTDEDCADGLGTCTLIGPVCLPGRCCRTSSPGTAGEPACERRTKRGICSGTTPGTNGAAACSVNADCQSNSCVQTAGSCDGIGGVFYGGDDGTIPSAGGTVCPIINNVQVRCPKYGAGVAPSGPYSQLLGPVSDSTAVVAPFGVALQRLGDDYKLSNPGVCVGGTRAGLGCGANGDCPSGTCNLAGPSFIALDYLRFVGGSPVTDRISFEFFDKDGNFVEDLFFPDNNAFGLHPVLFDPPLVIPAEGYVTMRVAPGFSPNARHVWASTNAVDVGTNDAGKLWVNAGPVNSNFGTTGILAFELEGAKAPGNFGACCYDGTCVGGTRAGKGCDGNAHCPGGTCNTTSTCNNGVTNFECRGFGGAYLGNASKCATCSAGTNAGQYCRSCSNNLATVCNSDADCPGGTCANDNGDCPGGGICTSEPACGVGGCCNPTTGACTKVTESACTSGGGNYLGDGTDCDASNGAWGISTGSPTGEAHCCPQPVAGYSGADNCEDVVLHVITAPGVGDPPKVVTITGNNAGATNTFANPDSCFDPSNDPNAERGWWEGFTLVDDCTIVYVDHCCTNPIHRPAYRIMYDSCPCGAARFTTPNPYKFPEAADSRGIPYCAEDDNAWQCFGLLGPGTYYYPIYSSLAGHFGQYQFHIVAEACATAACCSEDQCVDGVTQLQCDALGGFFLAPPHKSPAVTTCTGTNGQPGSTCYNGSCCTGPGSCVDVVLGQPYHKSDCDAQSGQFKGGVRCQGGSCAAAPVESCAINEDCGANGPCVGDAEQLAQASPCPICELEAPGHCQAFESNSLGLAPADRSLGSDGIMSADDITPNGSVLNSVCIWGAYLDGDQDALNLDCGPSVATDHFRVRLYSTGPSGRIPNTMVGESTGTSERGIQPGSRLKTLNIAEVYGFHIVLDTPITGLTPSATYWLEVTNDVTDSPIPTCHFFWMQRNSAPGSLSFGGSDLGYEAGFETPFEMSFCTDVALTASTVGDTVGACCLCDGSCTPKTLNDCTNLNGVWDITKTSCAGVSCPSGPPANDDCANSTVITAGNYVVSNQCATTDGLDVCSDFGGSQIDFDVWHRFTATASCNLTVSECQTGTKFDSMLAVYLNCPPGSPANCDKTVCPPCPLDEATNANKLGGCGQDESCQGVAIGGPGIWVAQDQIGRLAASGECFLLRIGSFPGSRGTANLDIACGGPGGVAPDPVVVQSNANCTGAGAPFSCCSGAGAGNCDKVRFISFTPPSNSGGETAIRINLVTLHQVVPPYTGQPTVAYTAFQGQSVYVGPPAVFTESSASGTPFMSSKTQCAPYYHDWNTVGLLHVRGSAIVPSSIYSVEHLDTACNGAEGSAACVTGGASVSAGQTAKTARWADVEVAFSPAPGQPNFGDVGSMLDKFRGAPGAAIKARVIIQSNDTFGNITDAAVAAEFGFSHIAACVDGFRGQAYPAKMGRCSGAATAACTTASDCTTGGNTGPCNLNCVNSP